MLIQNILKLDDDYISCPYCGDDVDYSDNNTICCGCGYDMNNYLDSDAGYDIFNLNDEWNWYEEDFVPEAIFVDEKNQNKFL